MISKTQIRFRLNFYKVTSGILFSCTALTVDALTVNALSLRAFAEVSQDAQAVVKTEIKAKSKTVVWHVQAPQGTKLNFEGPWQLKVTGALPFKGGATFVLDKTQFNQQTSQYEVELDALPAGGTSSSYRLMYFMCSTDNSWCKRLVNEGTITYAAAK